MSVCLFSAGCKTSGEWWPSLMKPQPPEHRWALAMAAVYNEASGEQSEFMGSLNTPLTIYQYRLEKMWNVTNRQQAINVLNWLEREGHRKSAHDFFAEYDQFPVEAIEQGLKNNTVRADLRPKVEFYLRYRNSDPAQTLVGWDFCRYIAVARMAVLCGYVSEQEAWVNMMRVAKKAQASFKSWKELGSSYALGYEYWSGERNETIDEALETVSDPKNPQSPWNKLPWDLPLEKSDKNI